MIKGLTLALTHELRHLLTLCPTTPGKRVHVVCQGETFRLSDRSRRLIEAELVRRGVGPVEEASSPVSEERELKEATR